MFNKITFFTFFTLGLGHVGLNCSVAAIDNHAQQNTKASFQEVADSVVFNASALRECYDRSYAMPNNLFEKRHRIFLHALSTLDNDLDELDSYKIGHDLSIIYQNVAWSLKEVDLGENESVQTQEMKNNHHKKQEIIDKVELRRSKF